MGPASSVAGKERAQLLHACCCCFMSEGVVKVAAVELRSESHRGAKASGAYVRATSLLLHSLEATSKSLLLLAPRAAGDAAAATDGPGGRPRPREAHHRAAGRVCAHAAERKAPGSARALAVRRGHPAAICAAAREPLVGQVQLHQLCAGPVRLSILRSLRRGRPSAAALEPKLTHTHRCRRSVQATGVAPTDDGFTVIKPGESDVDRDGASFVGDPAMGFGPLRSFGPAFMSHFKLKVRDGLQIDQIMLIDSPGMIDSPAKLPSAAPPPGEAPPRLSLRAPGTTPPGSQERGYDFLGVTRWLAQRLVGKRPSASPATPSHQRAWRLQKGQAVPIEPGAPPQSSSAACSGLSGITPTRAISPLSTPLGRARRRHPALLRSRQAGHDGRDAPVPHLIAARHRAQAAHRDEQGAPRTL